MDRDTTHRNHATLQDIASECGVAVSTVSRALTMPDRVSATTRTRILDTAARLGYTPSAAGRALSSGRTNTVALLVPDITNPFFFGVIRGTQGQLRAAGYSHVLINTEESPAIETDALRNVRASCDGAILTASRLDDAAIAKWDRTVPLVTLNRSVPGVPSVEIDTPNGAKQAIEHLVTLGHTKIVYVRGPATSRPDRRRREVLRACARRMGVDLHITAPLPPTRQSGAAAADAVLASGATGAVIFNDLIAIGLLGTLSERGIRVPQDLSVVGCDNIFGADFCHPPLTTIALPIEEASRIAAGMLLDRLRNGRVGEQGRVLPAHLVVRSSTTVPRTGAIS